MIKKLFSIVLILACALPLWAISETDALKKARALAGPMVEMRKKGYDGKNWKVMQFYLETPMCADTGGIVVGQGSTWDVALSELAKTVASGIPTVGGASNVFEVHVTGGFVRSLRMAIDKGLNGAESFRPPELNALDEWVQLHTYNPSALQNGLHARCPIFYGPALGTSGKAELAELFRVAN